MLLLFKGIIKTWAKEMDKQRYKEQDKRNRRNYYVDVCTKHAEMIQDLVEDCQDYIFGIDEQLTDDVLTEVKIEELEKCVNVIENTMRTINENAKVYDLPPNAKQAYNDSIKHLLKAFEYLLTAFKTKNLIQQTLLVLETNEITQDEFDELQDSTSNLTPPADLIEEYFYYRNLQLDKYKITLDIINGH